MKKIGFLLLMFSCNTFSQELPMQNLSPNEIIQRNTRIVPAGEIQYSLVPIVRMIISKPESFGAVFNEADKAKLTSYQDGDRGLEVLKSYKPQFEEIFNSGNVDAVRLGELISESREAEQMVYFGQLMKLIDSLSEEGQYNIRSNLSKAQGELKYSVTDWAGVAAERPKLVLDMANDFVSRIDQITPAKEGPKLIPLRPAKN